MGQPDSGLTATARAGRGLLHCGTSDRPGAENFVADDECTEVAQGLLLLLILCNRERFACLLVICMFAISAPFWCRQSIIFVYISFAGKNACIVGADI